MPDKKVKKAILITAVLLSGFFLFAVLLLPELIPVYKCASPCSRVESDAENIAAAIADYFSIPYRTRITPGDLAGDFESRNPWTFFHCGEKIYIYVYDHNEDCPIAYQNTHPHWTAHIFTKTIE